jgi:hypothetical protein
VGLGGVKRDRVFVTVRRTPELQANTRDPKAAGRVIDQRVDDIGGRLDSVYDGVGIPVSDVVDPMLRRAAQLEQNPATRGIAQDLLREAEGVEASWGANGVVNARDVRQYATSLGKSLFRGNPNTDPGLAKSIKQQVYGDIVGSVGKNVEAVKPGTAEELAALNAEMSDLLNMSDVVTHRAAREATPTTRLGDRLHGVMDWGIGIMHPGHLLAKKAVQRFGPGMSRAADEFIANSAGAPAGTSLLRESALLLRALEVARAADRKRDQERARMLGGR